MRTVSTGEVATAEGPVSGLSEHVQEALGELAGAAKEGPLALSVGVGARGAARDHGSRGR
jgi:hypothetical protein